jgi:hypothetical protein
MATRVPSRTGAPEGPGFQATPENLSPPETASRHPACDMRVNAAG